VKPSDWYLITGLLMGAIGNTTPLPLSLSTHAVAILIIYYSMRLSRRELMAMESEARRLELARTIMERGPTTTPVRRGES
jgi:hypothetical protein